MLSSEQEVVARSANALIMIVLIFLFIIDGFEIGEYFVIYV